MSSSNKAFDHHVSNENHDSSNIESDIKEMDAKLQDLKEKSRQLSKEKVVKGTVRKNIADLIQEIKSVIAISRTAFHYANKSSDLTLEMKKKFFAYFLDFNKAIISMANHALTAYLPLYEAEDAKDLYFKFKFYHLRAGVNKFQLYPTTPKEIAEINSIFSEAKKLLEPLLMKAKHLNNIKNYNKMEVFYKKILTYQNKCLSTANFNLATTSYQIFQEEKSANLEILKSAEKCFTDAEEISKKNHNDQRIENIAYARCHLAHEILSGKMNTALGLIVKRLFYAAQTHFIELVTHKQIKIYSDRKSIKNELEKIDNARKNLISSILKSSNRSPEANQLANDLLTHMEIYRELIFNDGNCDDIKQLLCKLASHPHSPIDLTNHPLFTTATITQALSTNKQPPVADKKTNLNIQQPVQVTHIQVNQALTALQSISPLRSPPPSSLSEESTSHQQMRL